MLTFELRLSLIVSAASEKPSFQKRGLTMAKWADKAVARLAKEEAERKRQEQADAQARTHIVSGSPYIWEQIVKMLQTEVEDFNNYRPESLNITPVINETIKLTSEKGEIELKFDRDAPAISYKTIRREIGSTNHDSGSVTFGVSHRELGLYRNKARLTEEELVEELLNLLI
jgi:hypothetical protein